jgi:rRNA methylases
VRGYFGVGIEDVSKPMNVGALWRTAHAFGAGFLFTVGHSYAVRDGAHADTARTEAEVPLYHFDAAADLILPRGCKLVGVEISDDAIELPSFRHPRTAAYVFGRERLSLSPALVGRCDYVVRIPTRFSVNVGIAGAIVIYDRVISLGRFAPRPVATGGPTEELPAPVFGPPRFRRTDIPGRD